VKETTRHLFKSLRIRLALWYGALLAVCLGAFSVAVYASFSAFVHAELDRRVHEDIELAARALIVAPDGQVSWPGGFLGKEIDEEQGGGHWLEVWSGGLRLLGTGTLPYVALGPPSTGTRVDGASSVSLTSGRVRVLSEEVRLNGIPFVVRAVLSEEGAHRQIRSLGNQLIAFSLSVLVLGGFGGLVLARQALAPLARMAEHARRITAEDLHERLSPDDVGVELNQVRDAFNETLERLERAFVELRRFTADASHELRTPLTALRSVGEVGLRGARTAEEYRDVIGTMLEEVDRLSRLADELLTLARAEAGQRRLRREPVDLAALAADVVENLGVLAEERAQTLETRVDGPVTVTGDRLALRQALLNLVDNAIKYAPDGTRVTVRAVSTGTYAVLEVVDEGPGIAAEHREKVFERFYRVDTSRSREMGGTGLGLSLVKWTAEAHGGSVSLASGPERGCTFRIVLPRV
jgi:heavy metal sensor kinase